MPAFSAINPTRETKAGAMWEAEPPFPLFLPGALELFLQTQRCTDNKSKKTTPYMCLKASSVPIRLMWGCSCLQITGWTPAPLGPHLWCFPGFISTALEWIREWEKLNSSNQSLFPCAGWYTEAKACGSISLKHCPLSLAATFTVGVSLLGFIHIILNCMFTTAGTPPRAWFLCLCQIKHFCFLQLLNLCMERPTARLTDSNFVKQISSWI